MTPKKPAGANGQGIRKNRQRHKSAVLASVEINQKDTFLIAQDIFNEPRRERIVLTGQKWVRFFDQNDEFLKGLIACVNNSPTLRRIITDKAAMITGDGFIPVRGKSSSLLTTSEKPEPVTGPDLAEIETAIGNVNAHGQNLADLVHAGAYDFAAFGNAMFELVKGKVVGESYCKIYNVPLYNVGIRAPGLDQIVRSYGIFDNWEKLALTEDGSNYKKEGFREIAAYPNWTRFEDGTERSIIHIKQYAPGYSLFGLPDWVSARQWAEIEYRVQRYNISKFDNSFVPSGFLQLFGSASQEEAKAIVAGIEKKFQGTGQNHKLFVQILRDEKLKAHWVPMTKELEGEFLELQQTASEKLVTVCGWSAALAGISTAGKLGSNQEIRSETEKVQNTVIKPLQNVMCSRVINPFLKELSQVVPELKGIEFGISNVMPVSFMGDINVESALSTDEKRELLGYAPLEAEDSADQNEDSEPDNNSNGESDTSN